ncbi:MAG TPA: asparagine synthase (glutamine-hydrolyzing) [Gemmatimonadales bacterium]|nr:asparagine synthase (glutamine-hydrolyzing) [Gemmatimonadales bacterium]
MCGIAGIIATDAARDVGPPLERLTAELAHRGPDGTGVRFLRGRWAAFGHRRLSIVDLAGGAQPMGNEDGSVWVVVNGELYNHRELRHELEAAGHRFSTQCDTEVLVHGWEEWGPAVLERLNGMYAFALFDGRRDPGVVWLGRDPVGVKPLYVGKGGAGDTWWFASELAAARRSGLVKETVRPEAVDEFLVYRFIPAPGTFFRDTWKLPPGHVCRLDLAALPQTPMFEPFRTRFAPAHLPRTGAEWEEALRDGLRSAVRRQLMADVPVGSLLSGGVDSTVVTRLMRDELPAAEPPQGFAIGLRNAAVDELAIARRAADALHVPLVELDVSEQEYLASWPQQIAELGEPIANSGVLLVRLLARRVRQTHKVVLSGQGADEPLGGYARHAAERFAGAAWLLRPLLSHLPERLLASDRVARLQRVGTARDEGRRFAETLAVFGPAEAVALTGHALEPDALAEPVRRWLPPSDAKGRGTDSLNRLLQVDARLSLADDLLIVADHASMASGVELRVPFLDLEFLALAERMPSSFKVSRLGERKWLYRKAVEPWLPPAVRPSLTGWTARTGAKAGFTLPLDAWFNRWLAAEARTYLCGSAARLPDVLRGDAVRTLLDGVERHGLPRTRQLLSLYVLETWLRGGGEAR